MVLTKITINISSYSVCLNILKIVSKFNTFSGTVSVEIYFVIKDSGLWSRYTFNNCEIEFSEKYLFR